MCQRIDCLVSAIEPFHVSNWTNSVPPLSVGEDKYMSLIKSKKKKKTFSRYDVSYVISMWLQLMDIRNCVLSMMISKHPHIKTQKICFLCTY